MVLISIRPFHLGKVFLFAAAVLFLSSAFCLGDPLFMSVSVRTKMSDYEVNQIKRPVGLPLRGGSEKLATSSSFQTPYAAICPFAGFGTTAQAGIGLWLDVTEMNSDYSWTEFHRESPAGSGQNPDLLRLNELSLSPKTSFHGAIAASYLHPGTECR